MTAVVSNMSALLKNRRLRIRPWELRPHSTRQHRIMWEESFRQFLKNRSDSELSDSSSNISLPSLEEFSTCANDEDAPISISSTDSFKESESLHLSSQEDSIVILSSPESVSNSPTSKAYQDLSDSSSSSWHDFDQRHACDNRSSVT
uniref:Uncharacterized protein n=1 Tax=Magallana gigas TaxID=29159 RepID=A0A8W8NPE2_MAGGI